MDVLEEDLIVIESVREDGRPFRPTDWIERISTQTASFGADHRLHYSDSVQPCTIDGQKCLVVDRHLEQRNPAVYQYILHFAHENHLRIQHDRRLCDESVAAERREPGPSAA